jgi:hypothetical protein
MTLTDAVAKSIGVPLWRLFGAASDITTEITVQCILVILLLFWLLMTYPFTFCVLLYICPAKATRGYLKSGEGCVLSLSPHSLFYQVWCEKKWFLLFPCVRNTAFCCIMSVLEHMPNRFELQFVVLAYLMHWL